MNSLRTISVDPNVTSRSRALAVLIGLMALAIMPTSVAAAPKVNGEFAVSGLAASDVNNKIAQGPDGNMWVTLRGANDVARIDSGTGAVQEFDFPDVEGALGITSLAGKLWITQDGGTFGFAGVTSFSPKDPVGSRRVDSIGGAKAETSIVAGPDGNLWMAEPGNLIRIEPTEPFLGVKSFPIAGLVPKDIDVAGSVLAIADAGGTKRIVTATIADPPQTNDFPLGGVNPQGVAGAPNGQVAFSKPANELGLLTPPGPPLLTQATGTDPFGVALGPDGAFWFAQFVTDTVTRLTGANQVSTLSPGFAKGAGPRQIAAGPGNTLWVTLPAVGKVGRISGVEPPGGDGGAPETKLAKGPKGQVRTKGKRAKVIFRFNSPDAGASFQCRMVRKRKGAKAPGFAACKSPKAYRLKPGRYRFEVRAVLKGVADESPASRSFKVVRVPRDRDR